MFENVYLPPYNLSAMKNNENANSTLCIVVYFCYLHVLFSLIYISY